MERSKTQAQAGQTLVLVALALVALLGITALAIDGGRLYSERRYMQNAADAGALAGARELCFGLNPTQASAENSAAEYATARNRRDASQISSQYANMANYTVAVTTTETVNMTFAGVLGFSTVAVSAKARAACGATPVACGVWPLGLPQAQWDQMRNRCGQTFYVWAAYNNGDVAPNCNLCDCDLDKAQPGPELLSKTGRAWLDFTRVANDREVFKPNCATGSACSGSAFQCWIANGFSGQVVIPPGGICVDGDAGVDTGMKDAIASRAGAAVSVPIFSGACGSFSCTEGYHVAELGCARVVGWRDLHLNDLPGKVCNVPQTRGVELEVACNACATSCGKTDGSQPPGGGAAVRSVSLID
jgi:hypothetical protein